MNRHKIVGVSCVVLMILGVLALNCSKTTEPEEIEETNPTFAPSSGPPGTLIHISDLQLNGLPADSLRVLFDDNPSPASIDNSGRVLTAIPLFLDTEGKQSPPTAAIDLVVYNGNVKIYEFSDAVTVESLPDAPGTADKVIDDIETIGEATQSLVAFLVTEPGVTEQVAMGLAGALDSLMNGDGPYSLRKAISDLEGDADGKKVLDGLFHASGITTHLEQFSLLLQGFADESQALRAARSELTADNEVTDVELARLMQFQVVLGKFGEQVIGESGSTFGQWVGTIAGLLGTGGAPVNSAGIIGAIFTVADFVVNKVVIGMYPAKIHTIDLDVAENAVEPGDTVYGEVTITALNDPPDITFQYLVGYLLSTLGARPGGGPPQDAYEVFEGVANFVLGTIQGIIAEYSSAHPELDLDIELSRMPSMSWEAEIVTPNLLDCMTTTPAIMQPVVDELKWVASEDQQGEGRVYVMPTRREEAQLLDLPVGYSYLGGSFGGDMTASDPQTVTVRWPVYLAVSFPTSIEKDGSEILQIIAGLGGPSAGIDLTITVAGGYADETTGVSGANGGFWTTVTHDGVSERIIITVKAEAEGGAYAEETVNASVESGGSGHSIIITSIKGHARGMASASTSQDSDGQSYEENTADNPMEWEFDYGVGVDAYDIDEGDTTHSAGAQSYSSAGYRVQITDGNKLQYSADFSSSGNLSTSGGDENRSGAEVNTGFVMDLSLGGGSFVHRATGSCNSPNCEFTPINPNLYCASYGVCDNPGACFGRIDSYRIIDTSCRIGAGAYVAAITAGGGSSVSVSGSIEPLTLVVAENPLSFGPEGRSRSVSVSSNVAWNLVDLDALPDWVTVHTRTGTGNGEILITVAPLPEGAMPRKHHMKLTEASGYEGTGWKSPVIRIDQTP